MQLLADPSFAAALWQTIPVEFLPPEQRAVLSVPNGTLRAAGETRLVAISDMPDDLNLFWQDPDQEPDAPAGVFFSSVIDVSPCVTVSAGYLVFTLSPAAGSTELPQLLQRFDVFEVWHLPDLMVVFACNQTAAPDAPIRIRAGYWKNGTWQTQTATVVSAAAPFPWSIMLEPVPAVVSGDHIWKTSGVTDDILLAEGRIVLWMSGFDDLQIVPIDPRMPGWMLRPEVAFRTRIPYQCKRSRSLEDVVWPADFWPQQYTYMTEEELVADLARVFGTQSEVTPEESP